MQISTTIVDLSKGETAIVSQFSNCFIACKLTAMGLLPGDEITLVRTSAFGNTFYLKTDNHALCLRRDEAKYILVIRFNMTAAQ